MLAVRFMTASLQPRILRFDSIDSTNLEAMRQAKAGAAEGLCIVAREQTAGRGRLDRSWHSPRDAGLYFSIILRPSLEMDSWPLITLMAALAVSDSLMKACGLRVDIKWPNDVYVNNRKLCGILAETIETVSGPAVVVGIGINLRSDSLSEELRESATSVEETIQSQPDYERVLAELMRAIGERYAVLQSAGGDEHTIREWCAASSFAFDRRVRVSLSNGSFEGTTRGLARGGALRVETDSGKMEIVRAGDVTALRAMKSSDE
jgi:BirA family transcriptional regulator, biotin operon repressor / biotin---[acetyl-CoA-carboxylase] ligase